MNDPEIDSRRKVSMSKIEVMASLRGGVEFVINQLERLHPDNVDNYFETEVLSTSFIVDEKGRFEGAILTVGMNGPTITINTETRIVKGTWGGLTDIRKEYNDNAGLQEYMEEYYDR